MFLLEGTASKCKGHVAEMILVCSRKKKKTVVAAEKPYHEGENGRI